MVLTLELHRPSVFLKVLGLEVENDLLREENEKIEKSFYDSSYAPSW